MKDFDQELERFKVEKYEEWRDLVDKIPPIKFPRNWYVRMSPPFSGAIVRFRVSREADGKNDVSVYLDWYERLGFYGEPYWEVYPYKGDVYRCKLNETDKLIKAIKRSLKDNHE